MLGNRECDAVFFGIGGGVLESSCVKSKAGDGGNVIQRGAVSDLVMFVMANITFR